MSSDNTDHRKADSPNPGLDSSPGGKTVAVKDTEMKRSAENTIKKYFHQLTSGCGKQNCDNENCRSSGRAQDLSKDEAAAMALKLMFKRAKLCDSQEDLFDETVAQDMNKEPKKVEVVFTVQKAQELIDDCNSNNDFTPLVRMIFRVFSSPELLNKSFLMTEIPTPESPEAVIPVDIKGVEKFYEAVSSLEQQAVENALMNAMTSLGTHIEIDLKRNYNFDPDKSYLHQFIILLLNPSLSSPEFLETALPNLLKSLNLLPITLKVELVRYWARYPKEKLKGLVDMMHQLITVRILMMISSLTGSPVHDDEKITAATKSMKLLYYASVLGGKFEKIVISGVSPGTTRRKQESDQPTDVLLEALEIDMDCCSEPLIGNQDFVNDLLNEKIEMDRDFTNYKHGEPKFSFLNYPFILNTHTKSLGLFYDNRVQMYSQRRIQAIYSLIEGQPASPYLRLRVRRDHIIEDALFKLEIVAQDKPSDLKKQLFVEFDGEQGIDEGGVSKEFFQLVVEELFNPDYGMFVYNNETNICWFNSNTFESDGQYTLVGLIFGLAIYNGIILNVHLPMVLYKKLLGKKLSLEDLASSHPVVYQSLRGLLDHEGDVMSDIMATFEIGKEGMFGNSLTHELKENGKDICVTNENRKEFATLYGNYLLNESIDKQFAAFKKGFDTVTGDTMLKQLFGALELEHLVCGSKEFDIDDLEESTEYDGGFTKDSQTIKNFWTILRKMSTAEQRQFLQFTTGSDRVPVGGLAKLRLIIARNGPDSDRLPTAHTCFNVLLMPDYSDNEKLKDRLMKAITHAKGFGLL